MRSRTRLDLKGGFAVAGGGKILSQAEIDDLIAKVQSGEISPEDMQKMMAGDK